ncbi:MAG: DUF190 domain-containing protein [Betaproteobacteria bacterium]|nr:DUF190 domain-containing protein [Betaproteobacteria bacterium]
MYVQENARHKGELTYEWVLERAKSLGIPGGTALRGIAGYGRHGVLEQEGVFELAPNLPILLQFVCSPDQADRLTSLLGAENVSIFYTRAVVQAGWTRSETQE